MRSTLCYNTPLMKNLLINTSANHNLGSMHKAKSQITLYKPILIKV